MGMIYLNRIETRPAAGEGHPFAPPTTVATGDDYAEWMRQSFRNDPLVRQCVYIVVRNLRAERTDAHTFHGPFGEDLRKIVTTVAASWPPPDGGS